MLTLISNLVYAETSPVALLQRISDQTIAELKAQRLELKDNHRAIHQLVRQNLLPYVDMTLLSRAVLGKHWNQASAAERAEFVGRFTSILINTYATALASYQDETVQFLPVRDGITDKKSLLVNSRIIRHGASSIPVSYRLVRRGDSWKVYDLVVDGVSLIQSYRSQFSSVLNSEGMPGLLKSLATHHAQNN